MVVSPVKIALLVDSEYLPRWQYHLLRRLLRTPGIHLERIIRSDHHRRRWSLSDYVLYAARLLDGMFIAKPGNPCRRISIRSLWRSGQFERLYVSEGELKESVPAEGVDVLLNLRQSSRAPEWGYQYSQSGIWALFFDPERQAYNQWTGVMPYVEQQGELWSGIGYQLQRQQPRKYLFLTSSSTVDRSLNDSVSPMLWKMAELLPELLQQFRDADDREAFLHTAHHRFATLAKVSDFAALSQQQRSWSLIARFLRLSLSNKLALLFKRFYTKPRWVLLYGNQGKLSALKKLIPPEDRYWADPCLVNYKHRYFVFLEEWLYHQNKGRIACLEWHAEGYFSPVRTVLERDYHLSYPFIFQYEEHYYLIPESAENRTVDLYRCVAFPDQWVFVKSLMQDIDAYDATLHQHNGYWWLFVNLRHQPYSSPNDLLYLFYANSPLSDQWTPHPLNPVVTRVANARSAGRVFRRNGKTYRPSQNCAGSYGRGLNMNVIEVLNTTEYKERTLYQYLPDGDGQMTGMHTLSIAGNKILSDGIYPQNCR